MLDKVEASKLEEFVVFSLFHRSANRWLVVFTEPSLRTTFGIAPGIVEAERA